MLLSSFSQGEFREAEMGLTHPSYGAWRRNHKRKERRELVSRYSREKGAEDTLDKDR